MARLTASSAVLSPKRRVSPEMLMTGSLTIDDLTRTRSRRNADPVSRAAANRGGVKEKSPTTKVAELSSGHAVIFGLGSSAYFVDLSTRSRIRQQRKLG